MVLLLLLLGLPQRVPGGRGPMVPGGPGGGGFFHAAMPFWAHAMQALCLVALVLVAVILVVVAFTRRRKLVPVPPVTNRALSELEFRYARGEISREDFLQRRFDLTGVPQPAGAPSPASSPPARPAAEPPVEPSA